MKKFNQISLFQFLEILEKNKIDYTVWKNLHLLDKSLNGLFNIDLFVPNKQKERF